MFFESFAVTFVVDCTTRWLAYQFTPQGLVERAASTASHKVFNYAWSSIAAAISSEEKKDPTEDAEKYALYHHLEKRLTKIEKKEALNWAMNRNLCHLLENDRAKLYGYTALAAVITILFGAYLYYLNLLHTLLLTATTTLFTSSLYSRYCIHRADNFALNHTEDHIDLHSAIAVLEQTTHNLFFHIWRPTPDARISRIRNHLASKPKTT